MRRLHVLRWWLLGVVVLVLSISVILYTGQIGGGRILQPLSTYFENHVGVRFIQSVQLEHPSADDDIILTPTDRPHQTNREDYVHLDPKTLTDVVTTSYSAHVAMMPTTNQMRASLLPPGTILYNANFPMLKKTSIAINKPAVNVDPKVNILFWTSYYGNVFKWEGDFAGCTFPKCGITTNKSLYNTSDAVIFHLWKGDLDIQRLPKHRLESQPWLIFSREPPTRLAGFVTDDIRWKFNMTIGYSKTSDVSVPYGRTAGYPHVRRVPKRDYAQGRTMLVAWVVSHCWDSSGRFEFVEELKKYVTVDVFGRCGQPCPGDDGKRSTECLHAIGKRYKFYLALENSDCIDYVTEKVWANAYGHNLVPIVRGSKVKFDRVLPPHSYINADNFKSVQELGEYLTYVHTNDHVYNRYFLWKAVYKTVYGGSLFCKICETLHKMRGKKKMVDLREWTDVGSQCNIAPSKGIQLKKSRRRKKTAKGSQKG